MAPNRKKKNTLAHEFVIEELIEHSDGNLRPLKPGDLDIDNHPGVREAFRMIYEWHRERKEECKAEGETTNRDT